MKLSDFDYELPEHLIAQQPTEKRDHSRMMVLDCQTSKIDLKEFKNILDYIQPGDVLVINETKVIPARLEASKNGSGVELFLLKPLAEECWEVLVKPGKRAKPGMVLDLADGVKCEILETLEEGSRRVRFVGSADFDAFLNKNGKLPLPPYIKREVDSADLERYQTVFAAKPGAVAAPTAGLHFTPEILKMAEEKGIKIAKVTLHVGLGTFRPVKVELITDHKMHSEFFQISEESAEIINQARLANHRIIAIGTTSVRALESAAWPDGKLKAAQGFTDIFIYPGYQFKVIDGLLTNFHLPKSSLLMLVSAFASAELIKVAYQKAVENSFRFFSYGDAMLILR